MQTQRAFTLLDLIAVALLLGVGLVLFFPVIGRSQEAARRASCWNDNCQIGLAMFQYAGDHDDRFMPLVDANGNEVPAVDNQGRISALPARTGFAVLLKEGYLTTMKVFVCPSSSEKVDRDGPVDYRTAPLQTLIPAEGACSYGWDPTKKHSVDACCALLADKPPAPVPGPPGDVRNNSPNHAGEGQNVFYNDGHIKWGTTPAPDSGDDKDIYLGDAGYENSNTDAKIIR